MSPTSVSRNIAAPQQKVWETVSDVTTFEHWHALHAGWEELPPSTIEVGATMVEKIKVAALVDTIAGVRAAHDVELPPGRGTVLNALIWASYRLPVLDQLRGVTTRLEFG